MAALLNRGWRLIGTALGFTLFGVGGLLLSLFWFPLLALCLRGERRRTLAQLTIRHSFRLFLGVLRGWGVLDYSVSGMPAHLRGALVVANHPSLLDYVMLAAEMPVCDCIVKQSQPLVHIALGLQALLFGHGGLALGRRQCAVGRPCHGLQRR